LSAPKVRFTQHAMDKFNVLRHYGFEVSEREVIKTILNPEHLDRKGEQYFAMRVIDSKHALRVVYEKRKDCLILSHFIRLGVIGMAYKIRYDDEADIITVILEDKGKISHAEEVGDIVVHFDEDGKPLFMEILKASKIIPLMVESLAKKEVTVA